MAVPRPFLVLGAALPLLLAAGCSVAGPDDGPRPPRTDQVSGPVKTHQVDPPVEEPTPEPTDDGTLDARAAYDALDAAVSPSNALIDEWNAAVEGEDWPRLRTLASQLADSLRELQTSVLLIPWPTESASLARDFAVALDLEIDWYSVVAQTTDDAATMDAVQAPWSSDAVDASDALWESLEGSGD